MRPFSHACENNKQPILSVLQNYLQQPLTLQKPLKIWEIGSGTGQHAVYFSQQLPHIQWQPTDLKPALAGINLWIDESQTDNLLRPLLLDVCSLQWPTNEMGAAFTANTIHIMSDTATRNMFLGVGSRLLPGGLFFTYGPFLYKGRYTSDSNQTFDQWLKERDPLSGIKEIEVLKTHAASVGLSLVKDHNMPANNQLLVWKKVLAATHP